MKKLLTFLLLACTFATTAHAQLTLHGMDTDGNLFTVDLTTGEGTLVGVLPFGGGGEISGFNEIVHNPANSRSYAQERDGNFRIQGFNHITAEASGPSIANGASWHALEYINGTLYGVYFEDPDAPPVLATLNPVTGVSNDIAQVDVGEDQVVTGIAWDGSTLFAVTNGETIDDGPPGPSALYTIALNNGASVRIGSTGMRAGGLSFGPDRQLYAGGTGPNRGDIYRIDTGTAQGTLVGSSGFGLGQGNGIGGLMTADRSDTVPPPIIPPPTTPPGPIAPVPAMNGGLVVLLLLVVAVGLVQLRRVD